MQRENGSPAVPCSSAGAEPPIRTIAEHERFRNRFVVLYEDDVEFSGGRTGTYVRFGAADEEFPGVVIFATDEHGNVGLVSNYRYPVKCWQWSLPRGFGVSEDPLATAAAELREETGYTATESTVMGYVTPDSGMLFARVAIVHARVVSGAAGTPVADPEINGFRWAPVADVMRWSAEQEIEDSFTLSALALAMAKGLVRQP